MVPEDCIKGKEDPPRDIYRPPRQWGQTTRTLFGDQSFETSLASYELGADGALVVLAREITCCILNARPPTAKSDRRRMTKVILRMLYSASLNSGVWTHSSLDTLPFNKKKYRGKCEFEPE
jgi:hypothetical protein